MSALSPVDIILWLAAGGVLGCGYFLLLHRGVEHHLAGATALCVVGLHLGRIAVAATTFWGIAQAGAAPLLLALGGFLAARFIVVRRLRGA